MKYVKMLGLAAVAAAALMAFVGASSASATVLCSVTPVENAAKTPRATCPEGKAYGANTEIHAVNEGNLVLTTGSEFTEITCKTGTVKGVTENEGSASETVRGTLAAANLTWGECSTPNGKCTVTTVNGGELEIHWINETATEKDTENGTLTSNGATVTSSCASIFGTIHCIYVTEKQDLGTLTGGNPATMDIESTPISQTPTSGLCPTTASWDAKYEVTTPKPLYVTNET